MLTETQILPPSSSLPPWLKLKYLKKTEIFALLHDLSTLYCPLAFPENTEAHKSQDSTTHQAIDSGYASGVEDEDCEEAIHYDLAALRIDQYERRFSERWLTCFIARASSLPCFDSDSECQHAVDQASCVLEALTMKTTDHDEGCADDQQTYTRDFSFLLSDASVGGETSVPVRVQLNDGLAGTDPNDPHDVGLQSWGASIVMAAQLCEVPARFGLIQKGLGANTSPRIIELGAGTGLIAIVLAKMLPSLGLGKAKIVATDYHQAVLANLRSNIARNFPGPGPLPIEVSFLDWSAPLSEPPLDVEADILIATDVVYAREHAMWLRDCAARLLKPGSIFWLLATVRPNGMFEGLMKTIETAFSAESGPSDCFGRKLIILDVENLDKPPGVGRGDESGYRLFRIGWG